LPRSPLWISAFAFLPVDCGLKSPGGGELWVAFGPKVK